jgi:hypothetical protein
MSSPLDRKFKEPSPYAPKWVRDAAQSDRRTTDPAVFEDAEVDGFGPSATPLGPDEGVVIERYRVPRSLEPTTITGPAYLGAPKRRGVGTLVRFGAAAMAAGIALLVVGKGPFSWLMVKDHPERTLAFGSRFAGQPLAPNGSTRAPADAPKLAAPQLVVSHAGPHGQGEAAPLGVALSTASSGAMVVIDGLQTGSNLNVGRSAGSSGWRLTARDLPNALVRPPQGFVGAMDLAIALRSADDSVADRKMVRLEWTAPVAATTQPMKPGFVFRNLDRDEIDTLVKRGEDFIAGSDLAAARLVLQRAAEGGDAGAALRLAGTYDPLVLEKRGCKGCPPTWPRPAPGTNGQRNSALPKRPDAWKCWRVAITKTVTVALVAPERLPNYQ